MSVVAEMPVKSPALAESAALEGTRKLLAWLEDHPEEAKHVDAVRWCSCMGLQISFRVHPEHEPVRSMFAGSGISGRISKQGDLEFMYVKANGIEFCSCRRDGYDNGKEVTL